MNSKPDSGTTSAPLAAATAPAGVAGAVAAAAVLALVNLAAYAFTYAPVIYSDDWSTVLAEQVQGRWHWFIQTSFRPFFDMPLILQSMLLGINIPAYHAVLWVLHLLLALLVFAIARQIPCLRAWPTSLLAALLFLLYPTDYTVMWLVMMPIYTSRALALGIIYLLIRFAKGGGRAGYIAAIVLLPLSLGIYDGHIGLIAACSVLLVIALPSMSAWRRAALLVPVAICGAFALWRLIGPHLANVSQVDEYAPQVTASPGELLSRVLLGYKVTLVWGWTGAVGQLIPALGNSKAALAAVAGAVVVSAFCVWLALNYIQRRQPSVATWAMSERRASLRAASWLGLIGLILVGAGYVPVILVFIPNLAAVGSRVNFYAGLGGVLFLLSLVVGASVLAARAPRQAPLLCAATLAPLLAVGLAAQMAVQRSAATAWDEQRAIWQLVMQQAPNLRDHTFLLIALPGYSDRLGYQTWERAPLAAPWEVNAAVALLYNNATLNGGVIFPGVIGGTESALTAEGVKRVAAGAIPYDQMVAVEYHRDTGALTMLDELPADWVAGAQGPVLIGGTGLVDANPPVAPLRSLLAAP